MAARPTPRPDLSFAGAAAKAHGAELAAVRLAERRYNAAMGALANRDGEGAAFHAGRCYNAVLSLMAMDGPQREWKAFMNRLDADWDSIKPLRTAAQGRIDEALAGAKAHAIISTMDLVAANATQIIGARPKSRRRNAA